MSFDLSRAGSQYTVSVGSEKLVEMLLGESVSKTEHTYLLQYGDYSVKYDDGITTATIHATLEADVLYVSVYEHKYVSDNGTTVVWIPDTAELSGEVKKLLYDGDGAYRVEFSGVNNADESTAVTVDYTLSISYPRDAANALINLAYNDAVYYRDYIAKMQEEHKAALAEYDLALAEYRDYLQKQENYLDLLDAYNIYVEKKRESDLAWQKYNEYLSDLASYNQSCLDYAEYEKAYAKYLADWAAYSDYLEKKGSYDILDGIYRQEMAKVDRCRAQLALIDMTKTPMTALSRTVYSAIMGGLVDTVLAHREDLESNVIGAPPLVIDMAGDATVNIRRLLSDYFALESEVSRYNYYSANYEAFRDNFIDLFRALDCLYSNGKIRAALISEDKNEKYKILVAQLYLIAVGLSDTPVYSVNPSLTQNSLVGDRFRSLFIYDGAFYIKDGSKNCTLKDILGEVSFTDTNCATPSADGFPTVPTAPIAPDKVDEPKEPDAVLPPMAPPTEVTEPAPPPTEVGHPGTPPTKVDEPIPPTAYQPPEAVLALVDSLDSDVRQRGDIFDTDPTLTFRKSVAKRFVNTKTVDVAFLDECGELLYLTTVDYGSAADYQGRVPEKPEDDRAVYTFAGWKDENGTRIDLSSVTSNLSLTPYYSEAIKSYKITWMIDGVPTVTDVPYGDIPSCPVIPTKPMSTEHKFVFTGWSPEPAPVTRDAVYTAIFREDAIISSADKITVSYDAENNSYVVDARLTFDSSFDISNLILLSGGEAGIVINTRFSTVTISAQAAGELLSANALAVSVLTKQTATRAWKYAVSLTDSEGNSLSPTGHIALTVYPVLDPGTRNRMRLYRVGDDGERSSVRFAENGENLTFDVVAGAYYVFGYEHVISLRNTASATLSTASPTMLSGERVTLSINIASGKRLERLYYVSKDGTETEIKVIDGKASFVMPAEDISLVPITADCIYTIVFVSDGKTVTTLYCKAGELPASPEAPRKPSDGIYDYTFTGWSEPIKPADCDKIYTAVFESSPAKQSEIRTAVSIYDVLVITAIVVLSLMGAAVITLVVITVLRVKGSGTGFREFLGFKKNK